MRVDVAALDRTQFKVLEEEGETLVIPLKDKYRWTETELHLRSLVLDATGTVISAGFPKFFNYGEDPSRDGALAAAIARNAVEFPEKLDGSLIVVDRIDDEVRLRTRGRRTLGEFAPEVDALIASEYPELREALAREPLLATHSLLFELVHPARTVVLRPEKPALFLLGYVDKATIKPAWDASILARISAATGTPVAPLHALPSDLAAAIEEIRTWRGKEGVVARFLDERGEPQLIKIKAEDYLRLHAFRTRLSGARATKLAWILELAHEDELLPKLAPYGLDWEATQFARGDVVPYLARRRAALVKYDALCALLEPWTGTRAKTDKRAYVERVRAFLTTYSELPSDLAFSIAMRLFDTSIEDARVLIDAHVLDEAAVSLRTWRKDPDAEIRAILTAPVREDDG
jgi:hypothetical protein